MRYGKYLNPNMGVQFNFYTINDRHFLIFFRSISFQPIPTPSDNSEKPCPDGFQLIPDSGRCADIDECASGMHTCLSSQRYKTVQTYRINFHPKLISLILHSV